MNEKGFNAENDEKLHKIINLLRERSKTVNDFVSQSSYFYNEVSEYEEKARNKFLTEDTKPVLQALSEKLNSVEDFTYDNIQSALEQVVEDLDLKFGKIAQPMRVALTGGTVSPGIGEVIEILGKETVLGRIQRAIDII